MLSKSDNVECLFLCERVPNVDTRRCMFDVSSQGLTCNRRGNRMERRIGTKTLNFSHVQVDGVLILSYHKIDTR